MKLAIISHTEHYRKDNGQIVGWGPTVREINHLDGAFDSVTHIAPLHNDPAPPSSLPYEKEAITYVPLRPSGGPGLANKVDVLKKARSNLKVIAEVLKQVDVFQFRAPTGIGNYILPWTALTRPLPCWVKYAGNWAQVRPPMGYRFQRWLLRTNRLKCPVTINGHWPGQPDHCLTFENPCLDAVERNRGMAALNAKDYSGPFTLCFAGRLDEPKGVGRILDALALLKDESRISRVHFVGDGPDRAEYEARARLLDMETRFHGFMDRGDLADILARSHMLLLPSTASEGFPKIIAEAANYGCLPIVSNVSSIGQYINGGNGVLLDWKNCEGPQLARAIRETIDRTDLPQLALEAHKTAAPFTFEHYNSRILSEILPRITG